MSMQIVLRCLRVVRHAQRCLLMYTLHMYMYACGGMRVRWIARPANSCLGSRPHRHSAGHSLARVDSPLPPLILGIFRQHPHQIHPYPYPQPLDAAMIAATRRWFRRNRTNLAIGAGVIGAGYVAGQYVLGKISEARQRMSEDRIAKEKYAISC